MTEWVISEMNEDQMTGQPECTAVKSLELLRIFN